MSTKALRVTFWITTVLFAVPLAWSAVQYLIEAPKMVATMTDHLGYPLYFTKILGVAKIAGVVALLAPFTRRIKEWAYAGFTFDLLGAAASHIASRDGLLIASIPLGFLVVLAASYISWHRLWQGEDVEPVSVPVPATRERIPSLA